MPRGLANVRLRLLDVGSVSTTCPKYLPVVRYIPPEEFDELRVIAESMVIQKGCFGPFVRSSYHAKRHGRNELRRHCTADATNVAVASSRSMTKMLRLEATATVSAVSQTSCQNTTNNSRQSCQLLSRTRKPPTAFLLPHRGLNDNIQFARQVPKANEDESLVVMSPTSRSVACANRQKDNRRKRLASTTRSLDEADRGTRNTESLPTERARVTWELVEEGLMNQNKTKRKQYVVHLTTDAASTMSISFCSSEFQCKGQRDFLGLEFPRKSHSRLGNRIAHAQRLGGKRYEDWDHRQQSHRSVARCTSSPLADRRDNGPRLCRSNCYYGDLDPGFRDGFKNGVHSLFPTLVASAEHRDRWGSIAGWHGDYRGSWMCSFNNPISIPTMLP